MFYGRRHNGGITPDLRYESVGRGFESLPSHQKASREIVKLFCFAKNRRGSEVHCVAGQTPTAPMGYFAERET